MVLLRMLYSVAVYYFPFTGSALVYMYVIMFIHHCGKEKKVKDILYSEGQQAPPHVTQLHLLGRPHFLAEENPRLVYDKAEQQKHFTLHCFFAFYPKQPTKLHETMLCRVAAASRMVGGIAGFSQHTLAR